MNRRWLYYSLCLIVVSFTISYSIACEESVTARFVQQNVSSDITQNDPHLLNHLVYATGSHHKITYTFLKRWLEDTHTPIEISSSFNFVFAVRTFFARRQYYTSRQYFSSYTRWTQSLRGPPSLLYI